MRRRTAAAAIAASLLTASGTTQDLRPVDEREARGRYLVERVGMCQDCHSPRDEQGSFDATRWLGGAPIAFSPLAEMPWSEVAPPLAGLPTMSHEQAVRFLMEGDRPDGSRARPPMPEYRLSREDAEAVVANLASLAPTE